MIGFRFREVGARSMLGQGRMGRCTGKLAAAGEVAVMAEPESRVRSDRSPWNWLLFIPIVLPLIVALFNASEPERGHHHARLPDDEAAVTGHVARPYRGDHHHGGAVRDRERHGVRGRAVAPSRHVGASG
jgi:hypothetical protein